MASGRPYVTRNYIHLKFDWEGLHRWPAAPATHSWLRNPHRHRFFATVKLQVFTVDRELEFFAVLRWIRDEVVPRLDGAGMMVAAESSCEQYAGYIGERLLERYGSKRYCQVVVFEDNENGGEVEWIPADETS